MSNQETRIRLLETALQLIWQSNYNSVGVNEICSKAGVTKGSFYHHFESKAVLFCEASEYYWESTRKVIDEIMSPLNAPLEQLRAYIEFIFSRKFDPEEGKVRGCPYFSSGAQTGCEDQLILESQRRMQENGIRYNQALVRSLQAEGLLEGNVEVERVARLMSQCIHGATSHARVSGDISQIKEDLAEGLFRMMGLKREYWFSLADEASGERKQA